ncbi:hypothetical protein [Pseudomonas putida]|uniref:Uncharacterized protein n=1 Tax=Pseudomonas putida TaxID=303 RepID=A0ABD7BKU8_PSEPU|nr:hypothetical protein [Pseudomonas putida]QOD00330.1 hypothetical protein ID616_11835 [Pseudomonas putida]GLO27599.1 hypothetical protein PPUJ21368_54300 [Pseudomonas putida]HDS0972389.1 hypothetical protein [Pseudomonas putida]
MTTPFFPSLIDDQVAEVQESMALPEGRILMLFKGPTLFDAKKAAAEAFIENPEAVTRSWWMCGEWTLGYEVRL